MQGRGQARAGYRGSSRGRFRAGFRGSSWTCTRAHDAESNQRPPSPPLGPIVNTIHAEDLRATSNEGELQVGSKNKFGTRHCVAMASFNWLARSEPTIAVPGPAPAFTPLPGSHQLKEDKGPYFRDINAACRPQHPMEAAVRAILVQKPNLATQDIDLAACSSTLGNLLRFVRGVERHFRFFVEVVGNTVFFIRRENSPTETIPGIYGYGHTFPEAFTTWDSDVKGSMSNQRLLRYTFAGLECLLRFECDGYRKELLHTDASSGATSSLKLADAKESADIASLMGDTVLDPSKTITSSSSNVLRMEKAGKIIPQEAIFDLKTRSARKRNLDVLGDEIPRYWLAQISNFVLALHENGTFSEGDIMVQDIHEKVDEWERKNQEVLERFSVLCRKIISAAKSRKDGKLEVRCKSLETIELREQDSDEYNVLPQDLKLRWLR